MPVGSVGQTGQTARRVGLAPLVGKLRERLWSDSAHIALRLDLSQHEFGSGAAKVAVTMEPMDSRDFGGFATESSATTGVDSLEARARDRMCRAGVRQLYVALAEDERPMYAQWCIHAGDRHLLDRLGVGYYREQTDHEVLLEGAYTFREFRGLRIMAEGMGQLLTRARQAGATSALTYVETTNIPSLRGCASLGFVPDHERTDHWRAGQRHYAFRDLSEDVIEQFSIATAPHQ